MSRWYVLWEKNKEWGSGMFGVGTSLEFYVERSESALLEDDIWAWIWQKWVSLAYWYLWGKKFKGEEIYIVPMP